MIEIVVISILVVWSILSILGQFQFSWFSKIREYDYFSLLPLWTFFAPNPGQTDYHIVYRDKRDEGFLTEWKEIEIVEPRRLYSFLWNPEKRGKKILFDVVSSLITLIDADRKSNDYLILSLPYLILLNVVCNLDATPGITHRQFAIVETFGFCVSDQPRVILRSGLHSLTDKIADRGVVSI